MNFFCIDKSSVAIATDSKVLLYKFSDSLHPQVIQLNDANDVAITAICSINDMSLIFVAYSDKSVSFWDVQNQCIKVLLKH